MNRDRKGMVIVYLIVGPICALLSLVALIHNGYPIFLALGLAWLSGCAVVALVVVLFGVIIGGLKRVENSEATSELSE